MVAFNWIALQEAHLLEVTNATMGHFSAFAGGTRCEVKGVNHSAVQATASSVKHDTGSVGTSANNEKIEFDGAILKLLHVLFA